jgi:MFS family permease
VSSVPSPAATHHPVDGLWSPQHRLLTIGLVLTITLVAFEALAVSTIMPIVSQELAGQRLYGWVFSGFLLASLLGIVVVGGLIDRGGLIRPFVGGLTLFSIGLVVGGLAPTMEILVAGRVLQGLGAGAIPPVAYVAIGRALPEQLRARMFATLSTAWVLPGVIGPAISGVVAEQLHWRIVFLGLLPLIAFAGALTLPALSRSRPIESQDAEQAAVDAIRERLPWALLVAGGTALVVGGLTDGRLVPGGPLVVGGLLVGIPAFRRLTPPGTLRAAPGVPVAVLARGFTTFAFFCPNAYVPLALQDWRGLDAATAGIALTLSTVAWTTGSWIQAPRYVRIGARRFVSLGMTTVALGTVGLMLVLSPGIPVAVGMVAWALAGLGMGLSYSPLSLVVLAESAPGTEGAATSGLQLSDVIGTAVGTGIGGSMVAATAAAGHPLWVGLLGAFGAGAVAAIIASLLARRLPGPKGHRRPAEG